jgi:hypothetical protein
MDEPNDFMYKNYCDISYQVFIKGDTTPLTPDGGDNPLPPIFGFSLVGENKNDPSDNYGKFE